VPAEPGAGTLTEVLRSVTSTLRFPAYGGEEAEFSGEPTVKITRDSDGAVVEHAAVEKVPAGDEIEFFTVEIGGDDLPDLDLLTLEWTDGSSTYTTYAEVVGGRMCSLDQIQEDVTEAIPTLRLEQAREAAQRLLEDECAVAWRPRYARTLIDGKGRQKVSLPDCMVIQLRSVKVEGSEVDLADVVLYEDTGTIYKSGGWSSGARNIEVIYDHGFAHAPQQAGRACALLGRHFATKRLSNMDDRSTSYSTDEATYTLITPGVRGMATAIPEVNVFIQNNDYRPPNV
jgi:hypothetical protein